MWHSEEIRNSFCRCVEGCFPDLTQFDIYVLWENFDLKCVVSFDIETFGYMRGRGSAKRYHICSEYIKRNMQNMIMLVLSQIYIWVPVVKQCRVQWNECPGWCSYLVGLVGWGPIERALSDERVCPYNSIRQHFQPLSNWAQIIYVNCIYSIRCNAQNHTVHCDGCMYI